MPEFAIVMRGYDRIEVDTFVDRVERTLAGTAGVDAVTPDSIESAVFSSSLRGYSEDEVDNYLDYAMAELKARAGGQLDPEEPPVWGAALFRERAELVRCAEQPGGRRFQRAGPFTSGYDIEEVDAFVDRVRGTLTSMLSADEVSAVRFGMVRRGYDEAAVDQWLAQVGAHLARLDQTR